MWVLSHVVYFMLFLLRVPLKQVLIIEGGQGKEEIDFSLSGFDRALVEAGGWVEYADSHY